jgi:hypothetical protein
MVDRPERICAGSAGADSKISCERNVRITPTSKQRIREELRQIYLELPANSPNVNKAWALTKSRVPTATRARVREVLREEEFSRQRRQPGKRRFLSEDEIPAAELSNWE